MEPNELTDTYRTLITASHILHYHEILDGYGHVSVRHPTNPDQFLMSRYVAPAIISSPSDLIVYWVKDAEPVDPNSGKGYSERCIHSECFKRYPSVQCVVHSHSMAVVPFGISGVPIKPCYHMAGFLGNDVPVYDIADHYEKGDVQDMLVKNIRFGAALAKHFSTDNGTTPDKSVVMMRGHGMTVVGDSIQSAVLRSIYTQQNAKLQTTALTLQSTYFGPGDKKKPIKYLSETETEGAFIMTRKTAYRPWGLWVREVEAAGLYVNLA